MDTLLIEVTNKKAIKLLRDLEELNLIRVLEKSTKLSLLRKKISKPMVNDEIDIQLNDLRAEWQ